MQSVLLIGYGEVGQGVYNYYSQYHNIDVCDAVKNRFAQASQYDLLLVSIPYSDLFVDIINSYAKKFNPKSIIIFSSVPIGTTSKIKNAVHSPVEGKHPNLTQSMATFRRFLGGFSGIAVEFFVEANQSPIILSKPEHTEFLKLQSTSNYGVMIEYARYVNGVCKELDMDYNDVKRFNEAYNELYDTMGYPNYKRYILDPPQGQISGHCVTPNSQLLDEQYPSVFLKEIYRDKE